MVHICYAKHCFKHFVLRVFINPRRTYEVCSIVIPILQARPIIGVQGHFVIKGTMRIQTQVVWLPKIFIGELKNNLDIY